jgi:hypothetical protein
MRAQTHKDRDIHTLYQPHLSLAKAPLPTMPSTALPRVKPFLLRCLLSGGGVVLEVPLSSLWLVTHHLR